MKAIETKYNGISFRSRLEARWAVFMDALGVKYDYEPEGYDLDGLLYLPDFWLPKQRFFLEIKPDLPTDSERERAHRLAEFTKKNVFIQCNSPRMPDWLQPYQAIFYPAGGGEDDDYWWCECYQCGYIDLQHGGQSERSKCGCDRSMGQNFIGNNYESRRLKHAYATAQSYRFWSPL